MSPLFQQIINPHEFHPPSTTWHLLTVLSKKPHHYLQLILTGLEELLEAMDNDVGMNALNFQRLMDSKVRNYCVDSRKRDGLSCTWYHGLRRRRKRYTARLLWDWHLRVDLRCSSLRKLDELCATLPVAGPYRTPEYSAKCVQPNCPKFTLSWTNFIRILTSGLPD